MLYNTAWETKTKPDVFSLDSLIAWLEKQRAYTPYCSWDLDTCLLGRWAKSRGLEGLAALNKSWQLGHDPVFKTIASIDGPDTEQHTFGAALERARAARSAL